jgi:hypothetical protein
MPFAARDQMGGLGEGLSLAAMKRVTGQFANAVANFVAV